MAAEGFNTLRDLIRDPISQMAIEAGTVIGLEPETAEALYQMGEMQVEDILIKAERYEVATDNLVYQLGDELLAIEGECFLDVQTEPDIIEATSVAIIFLFVICVSYFEAAEESGEEDGPDNRSWEVYFSRN